jgi:hypothetical protein
LKEKNVFGQAMQIENNVATIERDADDYHIVVTVEHRRAQAITQEEAEIVLTKTAPFLFSPMYRFGGPSQKA